jgi:hypothetical protein
VADGYPVDSFDEKKCVVVPYLPEFYIVSNLSRKLAVTVPAVTDEILRR